MGVVAFKLGSRLRWAVRQGSAAWSRRWPAS